MKIGVLGYGSIGMRHAANIIQLGHEAGSYDPAPGCAPRPVDGNLYCTREFLLNEASAVVVASPSQYHGVDFQDVIHAGKHVLVEKPFGYDCPALLDGFLQGTRHKGPAGLIVATGFNLRFHACVKKAKELIPELGEILSASFVVRQKTEKLPYLRDGIIRNWCSHEVDLAHYLLGNGVVTSCVAPPDDNGNDSSEASMVLEFDSVNGNVYLEADYYSDPEARYFWIDGTKATVYVDLVKRNVFMHDKKLDLRYQVLAAMDTWDDNYMEEMKVFIQSIECGKHLAPLATGEDGIRALYTVIAAREKAGLKG